MEPDEKPKLLQAYIDAETEGRVTSTQEMVDRIKAAIEQCSKTHHSTRLPSHPYWDKECQERRQEPILARRNGNDDNIRRSRQRLHKALKFKKKAYWAETANKSAGQEDWYQTLKRFEGSKKSSLRPPPIAGKERHSETEQIDHIAETLLWPESGAHDPYMATTSETDQGRLTLQAFTKEEMKWALDKLEGAPGPDGITAEQIRCLWPHISDDLVRLLNDDVAKGEHPVKETIVTLVPKKGRDITKPNGWRPIALSSVVGKLFEGTIASRLARTGKSLGWFSPGHAGGIPHVGAVDLIQATMHTLLRSRSLGKPTATLLMDVKNAFPSARVQPMMDSMRQLGIPEAVCKWVKSFMTNTPVQPRRGNFLGKKLIIPEGLPQGSPLSPILFAILISEIGRKWSNTVKIFADDIQVVDVLKQKTEALHPELERTANDIVDLLGANGLKTDPGKNELLAINKGNKRATITIKGQEVVSKDKIKYLGYIIDDKLESLPHVTERAVKARMAAARIGRLSAAVGGLQPKAISLGIRIMVLPSLTYASEAWYRKGTSGYSAPIRATEVAINQLLRRTLHLKNSTPSKAMWWEMGLVPISAYLEENEIDGRLNSEPWAATALPHAQWKAS